MFKLFCGFSEEITGKLFCPDGVGKCIGICFSDRMQHFVCLRTGYYRIHYLTFLFFPGTDTVHNGCAMIGQIYDCFAHCLCIVGYNKQSLLLMAGIKSMQYLRGYKLEYNGIQRLVPAKQDTCQ